MLCLCFFIYIFFCSIDYSSRKTLNNFVTMDESDSRLAHLSNVIASFNLGSSKSRSQEQNMSF